MKKIIYIIDNLRIGGAQSHLLRLAKFLANNNYNVEIISLDNVRETSAIKENLLIHRVKMDYIWRLSFWQNWLKLINLLIVKKPSLVHTYLNTANVFGVLAAKLAHVPVVISSRRDLGHFKSNRIRWLEKITARLSDKVVCVSKAVRKKVIHEEHLSSDKAVVIYNGVDLNTFKGRKQVRQNSNFNITMVATMDREIKGHSYFVQAAEMVIQKRQDVRFNLIGDGCLRPALEQYVNTRRLTEYFHFKGERNSLDEELENTDLLIVPSESEGCSNALLEAMAKGIPAIATAVEGNLEVIENGISGFLVRPKDPSAISRKVLKLLDSPLEMKRIGIQARERVIGKFSLERMVANYTKLYDSLTTDSNKIGYVVSLFPCWSEVFILNEILELDKKGIDVTIFSIRKDLENFVQEKAKSFIEKTKYINKIGLIKSLLFWSAKKPFVILSLFWIVLAKKYPSLKILYKNLWSIFAGCFFAEIVIREDIRHIHAHFATYPTTAALAISKLSGITFSFTAHAHDIFLDKTLLTEKAIAAKNIVAISDYNKQYISDYCKNGVLAKIKTIRCGVDLSEYLYTSSVKRENKDENIVVGIGRFTKMKGFEYLIKACSQIKARLPFKCYIFGEGPLRNSLQDLINKLNLNEHVFLKGVLDNNRVQEILRDAIVFALPCIWDDVDGQDGLPLVLVEAMALGTPVISTKISGIPELIKDGETGLLVEPKDEIQLSEEIEKLIKDKSLQENLSLKGRLKIEQEFDIQRNTNSLLAVFKED